MLVWNILSTFHFEIPTETLRLINGSLEAHLYDQEHPALRLMCAKALENILTRLTVQDSSNQKSCFPKTSFCELQTTLKTHRN